MGIVEGVLAYENLEMARQTNEAKQANYKEQALAARAAANKEKVAGQLQLREAGFTVGPDGKLIGQEGNSADAAAAERAAFISEMRLQKGYIQSIEAQLAQMATTHAFSEVLEFGDMGVVQKLIAGNPTVAKAARSMGTLAFSAVDFDNDKELLLNAGYTPEQLSDPEVVAASRKLLYKSFDGTNWSVGYIPDAIAKTNSMARLGQRQRSAMVEAIGRLKSALGTGNNVANEEKETAIRGRIAEADARSSDAKIVNDAAKTAIDSERANTEKYLAKTGAKTDADLAEVAAYNARTDRFKAEAGAKNDAATIAVAAEKVRKGGDGTTKQKNFNAANAVMESLQSKQFGGKSFNEADFSDPNNYDDAMKDVLKIEHLLGIKPSVTELKQVNEIRQITAMSDIAGNIPKDATGLVNSGLHDLGKYISSDLKGIKQTTAYEVIRGVIQHALYGSQLTENEINQMKKTFGTRNSQIGPLLSQLGVNLSNILAKAESIQKNGNPFTMKVRMGGTVDKLSEIIAKIEESSKYYAGLLGVKRENSGKVSGGRLDMPITEFYERFKKNLQGGNK